MRTERRQQGARITGPASRPRQGRGASTPHRPPPRRFPSSWPRSLLIAVLAMFLVPLLVGAPDARAQSADPVLLTNIEGTAATMSGIGGPANLTRAVRFTTGPHLAGYVVSGITVDVQRAADSVPQLQIWSSTEGGTSTQPTAAPNGVLHTFTAPSPFGTGLQTFGAPAGGVTLAANTSYWVVLSGTGAAWRVNSNASAASHAGAGSANGWAFHGRQLTTQASFSPVDVRPLASYAHHRLRINGSEVMVTQPSLLVANTGQAAGTALATNAARDTFAQSFTTGSHPDGYYLTSVDLGLSAASGVEVEVSLWSADSTPLADFPAAAIAAYQKFEHYPQDSLLELSGPAAIDNDSSTLERFTTSDVRLYAETTYWIVVTRTAGADGGLGAATAATPGAVDAGGQAGFALGGKVFTGLRAGAEERWADSDHYDETLDASLEIRLSGREAPRAEPGPYVTNRNLQPRAASAETGSSATRYATSFRPRKQSVSSEVTAFELTSVVLSLAAEDGVTPRVRVYEDTGGSPATNPLTGGVLTAPTGISRSLASPGRAVFSLSTPITLTPSTTYWLVLDVGSGSGKLSVGTTDSDANDPILPMEKFSVRSEWGIGDTMLVYDGSAWSADSDDRSFRVAFNGATDSSLPAVLNLGLPQVGVGVDALLEDFSGRLRNHSWQWQRGDTSEGPFTDIPAADGGTSPVYTPVAADLGKWLKATVTYDDAFGAGLTASAVSNKPVLSQPTISTAGQPWVTGKIIESFEKTYTAISFTTGATSPGYVLSALRLALGIDTSVDRLEWALHADNSGIPAVEPLFDRVLVDSGILDNDGKTFEELVHPGFLLEPNTRYWVVLTVAKHSPAGTGKLNLGAISEFQEVLVFDGFEAPLDPGSQPGWAQQIPTLVSNERTFPTWIPRQIGLEDHGADYAMMSILTRDVVPVVANFDQASYTVDEGSTVEVTVTLDKDPERIVELPITPTLLGGATGDDYALTPATVTFKPGQTRGKFLFTALGDAVSDPNESVQLSFGALPGVTPGTTATTTVAITNTGTSDTTAPALTSATVNAAGTRIDLLFSEVYGLPAGSGQPAAFYAALAGRFALTSGSAPVTVTVVGSGSSALDRKIVLRPARPIKGGGTVVLTYTDPTTGDDDNVIEDPAGNETATFTTGSGGVPAVTNSSTVDRAPELASATVNAAGNEVELRFDEPFAVPADAAELTAFYTALVDRFQLWVFETETGFQQGVTVNTTDSEPSAGKLVLTPAVRVVTGRSLVITYADPTSGDDDGVIEDAAGNETATFRTGIGGVPAVTNNSTQVPPSLTSATVNAAGNEIELLFDEAFAVPTSEGARALFYSNLLLRFGLTVGGSSATSEILLTSSDASVGKIVLLLSANVLAGQTVVLTYTDPTTGGDDDNVIEDANGNETATFTTGQDGVPAVTNNSTQAPPELTSATVNAAGDAIELVFDEAFAVPTDPTELEALYTALPSGLRLRVGVGAGTVRAVTVDTTASNPSDGKLVLTPASTINAGQSVRLLYRAVGNNVIQDANGNRTPNFNTGEDGVPAVINNSTQSTPTLTAVSIVSTPLDGDTYHAGENIEFLFTFSAPVQHVQGVAAISIDGGSGPTYRGARFMGPVNSTSGTTGLLYRYRVRAADTDTDGVSVNANPLGATADGNVIAFSSTNVNAIVTHAALGADSSHKVDGSEFSCDIPLCGDLSVETIGGNVVGAVYYSATSNSGTMSNRSFRFDSEDYLIEQLLVRDGRLELLLGRAPSDTLLDEGRVRFGDDVFRFSDGTLSLSNNTLVWRNSGLTWTGGSQFRFSIEGEPPVLTTAEISGSSGKFVDLVFNKPLAAPSSYTELAKRFTVTVRGASVPFTIPSSLQVLEDTELALQPTTPIGRGQDVVVTYTDPSTADDQDVVQDTDGNDVASFTTGMDGVPAVENESNADPSSTTLLSNFDTATPSTTNSLRVQADDFTAVRFTTGPLLGGYSVDSVKVDVFSAETGATPALRIFSSTESAGQARPNALLHTFTAPSNFGAGEQTFDAPAGGAALRPNTAYWLVFTAVGTGDWYLKLHPNAAAHADENSQTGWEFHGRAFRSGTAAWADIDVGPADEFRHPPISIKGVETPDVTPPTLDSAGVPHTGTTVTLDFTEPLLAPAAADLPMLAGRFAVTVDSEPVTFTIPAHTRFDLAMVVLSLDTTVAMGQTVVVTYTDLTSADDEEHVVQDESGNDAAAFTTGSGATPAVVNNSTVPADSTAPSLTSAVIDHTGATLTLTFDEAYEAPADAAMRTAFYTALAARFALTADGAAVTLTADPAASEPSAATLAFTLGTTVGPDQAAVLTYADPSTGDDPNVIEDAAGNEAASFTTGQGGAPAVVVHPPVKISFSNGSLDAIEGPAQALEVSLDREPRRKLEIDIITTYKGGATAADFSGLPASVTFAEGETVKLQFFNIVDDNLDDDGESVEFSFGTLPPGVTLGEINLPPGVVLDGRTTFGPHGTIVYTILDNDELLATFGDFSYTVGESDEVVVTVSLGDAPVDPLTIPITTTNLGGATPADYSGVPATLTFGSGESTKTFTFMATDDTEDDETEAVLLTLGPLPPNVSPGLDLTATVHIADDDPPHVSFAESDYTVAEGGEVTVTVQLTSALANPVTIPITATPQGGATSGDYSGVPANVTFGAGQTVLTFKVAAAEDEMEEENEAVEIGFGTLPPEVAQGAPATTTVSISDDPCLDLIWCGAVTLQYPSGYGADDQRRRLTRATSGTRSEDFNRRLSTDVFRYPAGEDVVDYEEYLFVGPTILKQGPAGTAADPPYAIPERGEIIVSLQNTRGGNTDADNPTATVEHDYNEMPNEDWKDWTLEIRTVGDSAAGVIRLPFSDALLLGTNIWIWYGRDIHNMATDWTAGTEYDYRIVSDPRSDRAAQVPGKPLYLDTKAIGDGSASLTWVRPQLRDDTVPEDVTYKLQWKLWNTRWDTPDAVSEVVVTPDDDQGTLSHVIRPLEESTCYTARVFAVNDTGDSEPSNQRTFCTVARTTDDTAQQEAANSPPIGEPFISGRGQVGETLTADTSGIQDDDGLTSPGYTYQWIRSDLGADSGTDIAGETGRTYVVTVDDVNHALKIKVAFTDDAGQRHSLTGTVAIAVAPPPVIIPDDEENPQTEEQQENTPASGVPYITGDPVVDETLVVDIYAITDDDGLTNAVFTYQWLRRDLAAATDTPIDGATGEAYTVTAADEGKALRVKVSFTDDAGNGESRTSDPTDAVLPAPLRLSDLDVGAGQDVRAAALVRVGDRGRKNDETQDRAWYATETGAWHASGELEDGSLTWSGITLTRVVYFADTGVLRLNEADPVNLGESFADGGDNRELTVWIKTETATVSFLAREHIASSGSSYINFTVPDDARATIAAIAKDDLIIIAFSAPDTP